MHKIPNLQLDTGSGPYFVAYLKNKTDMFYGTFVERNCRAG
jgi:hypothetical protein